MTDNAAINPAPPNLAGLVWHPIGRDDLAATVALARACLRADGGLPFLFEPDFLQDRYFPAAPGAAIGAFDLEERLGACAAVHLESGESARRALIVGGVRPDLRRRGLGIFLMSWSQAQARALLAAAAVAGGSLRVATESLTEPAHHLYLIHGFQSVFEEIVMRRDLQQVLPHQPPPEGVTLTTWQPGLAEKFFQAYQAAFRERPGFPGWSAAEWISRVTENDLIPEWSLLARAGEEPLGFVIGTIDLTGRPAAGYVWQIGVVPEARRRGLASALLVETMRRMQAAGAPYADLVVHVNNPGAFHAYAGLGFATIGRRARYERVAESVQGPEVV
ncbi:MAG: N-acetyltransferase [Anaerolineales bacterium]